MLLLPKIFSSNALFLQNAPLTLHGLTDAETAVCASIWQNGGQRISSAFCVSDKDGAFSLTLDTPAASTARYTVTVTAADSVHTMENVLFGELWLASGQSNMEFSLWGAATAKEDVPKATNAQIRLYDMKARWRTNAVEWEASVLDSLNHLQYFTDATWTECNPETAGRFSAIAYYFGKMLQDSLQIPVGLICNAIGGSPAEAWVDRRTLEYEFPAILRDWTRNDFIQDWVRGRAALNVKKSSNKFQRHPYEPCYLYESGILPLQQYPIKGVIWYQGESNAHNKDAHEKLFRLLVDSWRGNWKNPEMPFYFVQLSSINRPSWPWFRDSQRRLMEEIEHTGMAVCSDKGDSLDVHPIFKKEVGERLARWALNQTYGMEEVVPSGPIYKSVSFEKGKAYVEFDYSEGMRASVAGEKLRTFEIAGEDEIFYPAQAEVEGDKIKVWAKEVKHPTIVRYGWQPFTRANLVNAEGLPASTFRTDVE